MSLIINRSILYIKYSPDDSDIKGTHYKAIRPTKMSDEDFGVMLNFFKKIIDETRIDGARCTDDTLMKHNINHFCLSGGTVLFKIVECPTMHGSGIPELYGFYTPLSKARITWLEIDKMCYLLASETPGKTKNGPIDHTILISLSLESIRRGQPIYRSSVKDFTDELLASRFPINAALTCIPSNFYPAGVKRFQSGGVASERTDGSLKEIELEFDEKSLRHAMSKCNQPLKSAMLTSAANDSEGGRGLGFMRKKVEESKAIKHWNYEYKDNGRPESESCDFMKLDVSFEYSPIIDTFNSYTGKFGVNADHLPRVESARIAAKAPPPEVEEQKKIKAVADSISNTKANSGDEFVPVVETAPTKSKSKSKGKAEAKVHPLLAKANETKASASQSGKAPNAGTPKVGSAPPQKSRLAVKVHPLLEQAQGRGVAALPTPPPPKPAPLPPPSMQRSKFGVTPAQAHGRQMSSTAPTAQTNSGPIQRSKFGAKAQQPLNRPGVSASSFEDTPIVATFDESETNLENDVHNNAVDIGSNVLSDEKPFFNDDIDVPEIEINGDDTYIGGTLSTDADESDDNLTVLPDGNPFFTDEIVIPELTDVDDSEEHSEETFEEEEEAAEEAVETLSITDETAEDEDVFDDLSVFNDIAIHEDFVVDISDDFDVLSEEEIIGEVEFFEEEAFSELEEFVEKSSFELDSFEEKSHEELGVFEELEKLETLEVKQQDNEESSASEFADFSDFLFDPATDSAPELETSDDDFSDLLFDSSADSDSGTNMLTMDDFFDSNSTNSEI